MIASRTFEPLPTKRLVWKANGIKTNGSNVQLSIAKGWFVRGEGFWNNKLISPPPLMSVSNCTCLPFIKNCQIDSFGKMLTLLGQVRRESKCIICFWIKNVFIYDPSLQNLIILGIYLHSWEFYYLDYCIPQADISRLERSKINQYFYIAGIYSLVSVMRSST